MAEETVELVPLQLREGADKIDVARETYKDLRRVLYEVLNAERAAGNSRLILQAEKAIRENLEAAATMLEKLVKMKQENQGAKPQAAQPARGQYLSPAALAAHDDIEAAAEAMKTNHSVTFARGN